MSARFEVFEDKAGQYRWRLLAANGEPIAASESYTSERDAMRAIHNVTAVVAQILLKPWLEAPSGD